MGGNGGKYNIKAVSKMLGIQSGTLRAWERRYNMISPVRNEAGHRLYTEEHVQILKWLTSKVNDGFTISQAVSLLEDNNIKVEPENNSPVTLQTEQLKDAFCEAVVSFNEYEAGKVLDQAFSLFSIEVVILDILSPVLKRVGALWEKGEITTAHEHFVSAFIRSRIGVISHALPIHSYLPKALAVCAPGEKHELGLLMFTLFLRRKGIECIYLGQGLKEEDYNIVIQEINPRFLFFSCTIEENMDRLINIIKEVETNLKDIVIGIGGQTTIDSLDKLNPLFLIGDTKEEWENWLNYHILA